MRILYLSVLALILSSCGGGGGSGTSTPNPNSSSSSLVSTNLMVLQWMDIFTMQRFSLI